jgi:CheY-like chemotaxis protein
MEQVRTLQGRRILLVEDDYFVAQVITDQLEEAGAQVVGLIGWLDEALAFIKNNGIAFDGAVIDVSLHGKKSYPIADALTENGVYVVFLAMERMLSMVPIDAIHDVKRHSPKMSLSQFSRRLFALRPGLSARQRLPLERARFLLVAHSG